jgi:hypothetical protein
MIVKCSYCGKEIEKTNSQIKTSKTKNFFCNNSCAASFNNSKRTRTEESKNNISNIMKEKYFQETGFSSYKEKKKSEKICSVCGETICKHPQICSSSFLRTRSNNLKNLGFNMNTIGTTEVYSEYYKVQKYLFSLYHIKNYSFQDIMKEHNIKYLRSMELLFKFFEIERRTISEAVQLSVLQGKQQTQSNTIQYKTGFHTSWEGKLFFYRSSYELDYMKELDSNKESYEYECFRIPYYNTQKERLSVAVPDFYIPNTKTIVEIKSNYTYDKQEMIDKSNEYKRLGFNFKLILEHIEYDYCV